MKGYQKISLVRQQKGITQEQLSEATNISVRTIQRIENGQGAPRSFTIKTIAAALDTPFEYFHSGDEASFHGDASVNTIVSRFHYSLICLSGFSYIVIPFVHFLIPMYLIRKYDLAEADKASARSLVRGQIMWVITTQIVMLVTLAFNLIRHANGATNLSYLWPMFVLYGINALLLLSRLILSVRST